MSRALLITGLLIASLPVQAKPREERVAVIVGDNFGDANDDPLRYAERDAQALRRLLIELGNVGRDRALMVLDSGPGEVLQALREARGRAAELTRAGSRVLFIFYYSGHGDDSSLHLSHGRLPLAQLRRELDAVAVDVRLALFDTCRTAARQKGAHRGGDIEVELQGEPLRGSVELWASSAGEVAQESEELGGAVFTHYVMSALRGAADFDGDGRVTLGELYAYAYRHTALRTGVSLATQHPSLAASLAGAGELELSAPTTASAVLELPSGGDRYLIFAWPTATALAEVGADGPRRMMVPAGRYVVVKRRGDRFFVTRVDVPWGGSVRVIDATFRPIDREELEARGGRLEVHPFRLRLATGVEISPNGAALASGRVDLAAQWVHGGLVLQIDVGAVAGPAALNGLHGQESALRGGGLIGIRLLTSRLELSISGGIEMRSIWQSFTRNNAAILAGTGLVTSFGAWGVAAGPRAAIDLAISLRRRVSLTFDGSFVALFAPLVQGSRSTSTAGILPLASLAAGVQYEF